jgi:hypothetical protein
MCFGEKQTRTLQLAINECNQTKVCFNEKLDSEKLPARQRLGLPIF